MARLTASIGPSFAVIATMTTGKTSRMPKTAMRMPMVRKIFCQKAFILRRMPALMTALSNESEISRMERIPTIASPRHPQSTPARARPSTVTANDQPKVFRSTAYPILRCLGSPARGARRLLRNVDPEV